jgi:hypothetical protein
MELFRHHLAFVFPLIMAVVATVSSSWALDASKDGWFHTGDGIRYKKVAFVNVKVYAITHAMKQLPSAKSKQAVIDIDTDKKISFRMLRDVDAEKLQNALREAYQLNGYGNGGNIDRFVGAMSHELKEGQWVHIVYSADSKTTSIRVDGGGTAKVEGADFMKATWSIWFGKIDQPALGDALIAKI